MEREQIEALFTRADGLYLFARWGRPIAPIVFGVEDETLAVIKGAIEAVAALANHPITETDPELGSNLMLFFLRDWDELADVPGMDRLIPDLLPLLARLKASNSNQYRVFRFDEANAIRACFAFVRMDAEMTNVPAADLALQQAVNAILLWSDTAFTQTAPFARVADKLVLRPEIADLIRAAYDPVMPAVATDASHALRLSARVQPPS